MLINLTNSIPHLPLTITFLWRMNHLFSMRIASESALAARFRHFHVWDLGSAMFPWCHLLLICGNPD